MNKCLVLLDMNNFGRAKNAEGYHPGPVAPSTAEGTPFNSPLSIVPKLEPCKEETELPGAAFLIPVSLECNTCSTSVIRWEWQLV